MRERNTTALPWKETEVSVKVLPDRCKQDGKRQCQRQMLERLQERHVEKNYALLDMAMSSQERNCNCKE